MWVSGQPSDNSQQSIANSHHTLNQKVLLDKFPENVFSNIWYVHIRSGFRKRSTEHRVKDRAAARQDKAMARHARGSPARYERDVTQDSALQHSEVGGRKARRVLPYLITLVAN